MEEMYGVIKALVKELADISANIGQVKDIVYTHNDNKWEFRSNTLNELSTALSKAQGEFEIAGLNKSNPYFKSKYADLASVVSAARPSLTKYGLSVVQNIVAHDDGTSVLHTILLHSSGQYIESRMRILPAKSDIQSISSYTTYIKRMAYASLVGVVTGDESDDDGEAAVATERAVYAKGVALNNDYKPQDAPFQTVSKDQLDELEYELEGYPNIAELMLNGYKIQSIADLPKRNYLGAITRIRELKLEEKKKK